MNREYCLILIILKQPLTLFNVLMFLFSLHLFKLLISNWNWNCSVFQSFYVNLSTFLLANFEILIQFTLKYQIFSPFYLNFRSLPVNTACNYLPENFVSNNEYKIWKVKTIFLIWSKNKEVFQYEKLFAYFIVNTRSSDIYIRVIWRIYLKLHA